MDIQPSGLVDVTLKNEDTVLTCFRKDRHVQRTPTPGNASSPKAV
jgi:hypothetical protein